MKIQRLILILASQILFSALYGQTPVPVPDVFEAARKNDVAAAEKFIAGGGDVNKPGAQGYTALIIAAYNGSADVVGLLLKSGADVHAKDATGSNALMGASFRGHQEIAAQLIKAGSRVNDVNLIGGTALMFASLVGKKGIVDLLIENGANPALKDKRGLDAATLAEQQGNEELAVFLRRAAQSRKTP